MFLKNTEGLLDALDRTLKHARGASFYARRLPKSLGSLADFEAIKTLDKNTAARVQESLRVKGVALPDDLSGAGIVSSATTRQGRPLRILRAPFEHAHTNGTALSKSKTRTLRLASPRHGVQFGAPDQVVLPATHHENTADVMWELLHEQERKIIAMVSPVSTLKWTTLLLQSRGIKNAKSTFLKAIGTTGYCLTAHAKLWLEAFWGVALLDNYSLSELPGYAAMCTHCGYQHWEGAPIYFELLDPLTQKPTRAKWGELVATTIVPSVRLMPLIRYQTGDLIERGPLCKMSASRGVRFIGRKKDSIVREVKGKTALCVSGRSLLEWGEKTPEVAQVLHPVERLGRLPPSGIGVPKVRVQEGAVHAELRFDTKVYAERAKVLENEIKKLTRHGVSVFVHGPGALDMRSWARKL